MPRPTTTVAVRDQAFVLERQLLNDMPDAVAFIAHLLDRRVSPHTARLYAMAVCRLKRRGQLGDIKATSNVNERTAANAYTKWRADVFLRRAQEIAKAIPGLNVKHVRFLRRHSLAAPAPGKLIPVHEMPGTMEGRVLDIADYAPEPGQRGVPIPSESSISWQPADTVWTLHVPKEFVAPHSDPCPDCVVFVLDAAQIEAVAVAFEQTWGHRDLSVLPPEAYLFGTPPPEAEEEVARKADEKAVAIVSAASTRADDMERIGVPVVLDVGVAIEKLSAVDGIYLSRVACGGRLQEVLGAVWSAWGAR